jgi:peptide/nickel transport system ATP-binding protein
MSAVPTLDGQIGEYVRLSGEIPSAMSLPRGCVFQTRCPRKLGTICETEEPPLRRGAEAGHEVRCHIPISDLHAERGKGSVREKA